MDRNKLTKQQAIEQGKKLEQGSKGGFFWTDNKGRRRYVVRPENEERRRRRTYRGFERGAYFRYLQNTGLSTPSDSTLN